MITKEKKNKLPKLSEMKQYIYWFVCKNVLRAIDSFEDILIFDFIHAMNWGINPNGSVYKVNLWGDKEEIGGIFYDIYLNFEDNQYKLSDSYWIEKIFLTIKQLEGVYYDN